MVIVKTIELNFEDTELEPLYLHHGEKGRGYILVPPVDVAELSCQIEMVKPDYTFVINDLSYDESGNVILEVPEQACTVIGVGWYTVNFYNDDVVIYTCYGRFQVDDHVINDDMIESIAEVNGYKFPQDFVTQGDIEHIADEVKTELIVDNVYSDSATWSSEKIANFVNDEVLIQVDNIYNTLERITTYSTDEQVVGKWIDGKPLYRKTVLFGSVSGSSSSLPLGIANVDYINYLSVGSSVNSRLPLPYVHSQQSQDIGGFFSVSAQDTFFELRVGSASVGNINSIILTVQYTKTTDTR